MRSRLARVGSRISMLLLAASPAALGRSEAEVTYTREQAFSAALRYLRVDLAYEVTEKDADAAYLLFSFPAPELEQKSAHGSIEVVQTDRSVRLLVSLPQLPAYREDVLKSGLLQKLRVEYGEPPRPEKAKKERSRRDRKPPEGGGSSPEDGSDTNKPEPPPP
jgi:hypothetical protein